MLYGEIVEYVTKMIEEENFNVFHITRKYRIGYDMAQSYINELLKNGIISEVKISGINNSYKIFV
ncbi:hypothetical protein BRS85_14390 [Listeria monocytogenes]|nr:hypothetical protein [Listeria monocytogenes]MBC6176280.1 hypothetical protein [Listeria welshimeri]AKI56174.1 Ftsk gamma domain protein [Listeria monocytogenes]EAC2202103.1 hypothetical protein [Listeria monocytogenes]EAC2346893.1 hypothetical protein [Listeria monocytogenes]EAC3815555.1 hypothetical protein [Listeria monocytogenes]